jgi:DNA-binding NtrC family response regulator
MRKRIWALLVYGRADYSCHLRQVLAPLAKISEARTYGEAMRYLEGPDPPHLVFTDTLLPDGTWVDVLVLAQKAPKPVNVIVVARVADFTLYVDALERGAFDLITAPSLVSGVAHVWRPAKENVLSRRQAEQRLSSGSDDELDEEETVALEAAFPW